MRKTKIVCTIGPASSSEEVFAEMCRAGLNVARLNFSHGTHEEHQQKFDMIRKVRRELELPIAIMLDTKGPEYRIRTFRSGKVTLAEGDTFTFTTDESVIGVGVRSCTCSSVKCSRPSTLPASACMSRSVQPGCDEMK